MLSICYIYREHKHNTNCTYAASVLVASVSENEGVVFFFFCINRSIFNRILPYTVCLGNVCYTHFIVHIHRYILRNDIFTSQL